MKTVTIVDKDGTYIDQEVIGVATWNKDDIQCICYDSGITIPDTEEFWNKLERFIEHSEYFPTTSYEVAEYVKDVLKQMQSN